MRFVPPWLTKGRGSPVFGMTAVVTAVHFIAIGMGANLVEFGPALALLLVKSLSGAATVAIVGS